MKLRTSYNTDFIAIAQLLAQYQVPPTWRFALQGAAAWPRRWPVRSSSAACTAISLRVMRNAVRLADLYGFGWQPDLDGLQPDLLITATPLGMTGAEQETLAFSAAAIAGAQVVFDVVALPAETPLIRAARAAGKTVITGAEVFAIQAVEQFVLYTGVRPDDELFQAARRYARG